MASNRDKNEYSQLEELGGSEYKVVDDQPNIKGWDVKDDTGLKFGKVDELIFNPNSKKVRYLVLNLNEAKASPSNKRVLVPIGKAQLHEKGDEVILSGVTSEQLERLPVYEKGNITASTESKIRNLFSTTATSTDTTGHQEQAEYDENFYNHEHFDEDRFYGKRRDTSKTVPIIEENVNIDKRREETGGAHIRTSIEEESVEKSVNLREEHVDVNRRPTDRPASEKDLDTFKDGEMEIKTHKEVPVINKEARVVEEIDIKKEVSEEEKTIRDTERRTEVDTERIHPENKNDPNRPRDRDDQDDEQRREEQRKQANRNKDSDWDKL